MRGSLLTVASFAALALMVAARLVEAGVPGNGVAVPGPAPLLLVGLGAVAVGLVTWWRGPRD